MKKAVLLFAALASMTATSQIVRAQQSTSPAATKERARSDERLSRRVKGRVLTSTEMPAVSLRFDKAFKYIGGQSFILYDVARAEQHFFVDADKQGRIRRLYWVQFEGYLPSNTHSYKYQAQKTVNVGGLEFIADSFPRNLKTSPSRPNSDGERARAFLNSKGYLPLSDDLLLQRLVHLVDEAKRNELMIIYTEDLSGMGLTAADLTGEGRAASRWDALSGELLERATKGFTVQR